MPTPSLPRRVWTSRTTLGFALMFLIVAAIMVPLALFRMKDANLPDRDMTTHHRNTGATPHSSHLTVRFTDAQSVSRTARPPVSLSDDNRTTIGSAMTLRHAGSDPTVSAFEAGKTRPHSLLIGIVGAISGAVSGVFAWALARSLGSQRRAARIGERRMAQVTERVRNGKTRSKYHFVHWQAGDLNGRSMAQHDPRTGRGWWEGAY
ncbi:hypothetical protein [Pararhodobacter zhoushanensis]|uniref:DUF3592 domain-containing protein n=1 Tax=Pararhodobacter zhoushanensis TaxID=2479545 RepID=A0ABT3H3H3_9RHOB|nr:hypothetical protein [Pararhodobacter zhoushanensis]MCW1934343.1 hypothetical protein [Pararhodobacter zhoushanensis]